MDFDKSRQEIVLECAAAASENPSTTTDLSLSLLNETSTSEILTSDERQSVDAAALSFEDPLSPAETDTAKCHPAETLDEQTVPVWSSTQCATEESQSRALSHMKSTLQEFQTLRAKMLSQLETPNGLNKDDDPTVSEAKMIIQRLLESLELGIGELQACISHVISTVMFSVKQQIHIYVFSRFITADVAAEQEISSNSTNSNCL